MNQSADSQPSSFLRDLSAIALLWVMVIACYWRTALAGRVLADGDIFTYFYPYWAEATRAVRAGRLPLWNPYLFMGAPFLANSQVGFFYPLNWPLWLLLPAQRAVHLTIVLHLCLAALNAYLWARVSLRLSRCGAWAVGGVFALGGYLGAQVEHINQLQGLAWLPLMLTLYHQSTGRRRSRAAFIGLAVVVGLVLLAGHTQTAFISLVGLAVYGLGPLLWGAVLRSEWKQLARHTGLLVAAAMLGVALAGVQLSPTLELSRLSVRAQGLPFNERVSFSLSPFYLGRALMPRFAGAVPPDHVEHVAYVGIAGLALAVVGFATNVPRGRHRQSIGLPIYVLVVVGLLFALGLYNPIYLVLARYVPGFAHFRVPARWLALYVIGVAGLVGGGVEALWHHRKSVGLRTLGFLALGLIVLIAWAVIGVRLGESGRVAGPTIVGWAAGTALTLALLSVASGSPRLAVLGLLALLVVELFGASAALPHVRATAPQAFSSLRPSVAHLLASSPPSLSGEGRTGGGRFLSMSDITFDPGDLPEIKLIYGPQLPDDALYDYVVAAKQKEVLSPNLPLAFEVPAVDGYGGGVLPLARYVTLQRLFLPQDRTSIDGRLRENLTAIPDGRWLSLFNVRYVITDKLRDAWLDDVFYDLQFGARLSRDDEAAAAHIPCFEATALGVVSTLRDGAGLPDGAPVGTFKVGFRGGITRTFTLRAGEHTAASQYGPDVSHAQATVGREDPRGIDYVTRLRWVEPAMPVTIVAQATLPEGELVVRGVSLIDERTGGFQTLVLSDQGRFRLAHSGDVKIYENLDVLPRAFFVHKASPAPDDEAALALMQASSFDPASEVVLTGENVEPLQSEGASQARGNLRVVSYSPERLEIEVTADAPGYLVLTDAWYPGWQATVDREPVPIHRADLLFRAVPVEAGQHHVVLTFCSTSLFVGAAVSVAGLIGLIGIAVLVPSPVLRSHFDPTAADRVS